MDVLSNISCCFDASKDIAETGVELVFCDIPVSKKCCLKWETLTYMAAVVFSTVDLVADVFGYVSFVNIVSDKEPIQIYIDLWFSFMVFSGFLIISEIALPIYSIVHIRREKTEEEADRFRTVTKYWSRANNVFVIIAEDGFVAIARILIAFKSEEALEDLQNLTGEVTSCITFVVTLLRHFLLISQIVMKLSRNKVILSRHPRWEAGYCTRGTVGFYMLFFTTLFLSCISLGLTGMSMAISLDLIEIHLDDNIDFLLNITLMSISIPGLYIFSVFVVILTRW